MGGGGGVALWGFLRVEGSGLVWDGLVKRNREIEMSESEIRYNYLYV